MEIPKFDEMMNPLLEALHKLGGSATIDEITSKVIEIMRLPDEITELPHSDKSYQTEVEYRLAWTKTYLKKYGVINNPKKGIWELTEFKEMPVKVEPKEVKKFMRSLASETSSQTSKDDEETEEAPKWIDELNNILLSISPDQFERLTKRILMRSGFTDVEVTGKSGDGGIDGKGIIKIAGLLSFHVFFQCKRYSGKVSASNIRDFRGALQGRADKGLLITTGGFTKDALLEAKRDGAPPIDLIDGEDLALKLKELSLGVKTEMVEEVIIESDFFKKI